MRGESVREYDERSIAVTAVLLPSHLIGYIGAGTGSLIIQVAIAVFVGGLFALKIYWRRIIAFFKRGEESEQ